MRCSTCGSELEFARQGHTCRSSTPQVFAPPGGWVIGTWVVATFAVVYMACAVILAVVTLELPAVGEPVPAGALALVLTVSAAWLAVLVGTIVSQVIWNRQTRRLAERYGFDGSLVIKGWFLRVYAATVVVTVCLQGGLGLSAAGTVWVVTAIRVTAGLFLLANVLVGRARLLGLIADANRQVLQAPSS
ncbi:hypothetical protein [Actinoplanes sp. NBRC 103695]|uniref:hypothetical protein n=1 Tax=Actinoplanes sp. NBRC 103695 TaxID=3032202 RepID=UPI0025526B65|nr:hypothetical protein [Actinoplanes sp. NBRC 103695]